MWRSMRVSNPVREGADLWIVTTLTISVNALEGYTSV